METYLEAVNNYNKTRIDNEIPIWTSFSNCFKKYVDPKYYLDGSDFICSQNFKDKNYENYYHILKCIEQDKIAYSAFLSEEDSIIDPRKICQG